MVLTKKDLRTMRTCKIFPSKDFESEAYTGLFLTFNSKQLAAIPKMPFDFL